MRGKRNRIMGDAGAEAVGVRRVGFGSPAAPAAALAAEPFGVALADDSDPLVDVGVDLKKWRGLVHDCFLDTQPRSRTNQARRPALPGLRMKKLPTIAAASPSRLRGDQLKCWNRLDKSSASTGVITPT